MWYGSTDTVPEGWAICDGSNGTPNLVDRFVVGAGSAYGLGAQGGSTNATAHFSGYTDGTVLNVNQIPSHNHYLISNNTGTNIGQSMLYDINRVMKVGSGLESTYTNLNPSTATGGNQAHNHYINNLSANVATTPPYYALYYIMKL